MRAVIYARYSSDLQREASIEDQVRLCKERIQREGWHLSFTYVDKAMSGASHLRPGYQRLLNDARQGQFDVVVSEALDRLSRDQEHTAALFKQLSFNGIRILTLAEGDISELHVGLKGTMNALFLKDLASKIRRGQQGRISKGRSPGGLPYGYDVIREIGLDGEVERGKRKINVEQASVIRRIFDAYVSGTSPRAIAARLNQEGIPAPRGGQWNASTINGNRQRRDGILWNELYIGRLIYNRQRFVKDPTTGRRIPRPNPEREWIIVETPELQIVDQKVWDTTRAIRARLSEQPLHQRRKPRRLLSGLLVCGVCRGSYTVIGEERVGCATHREKGTCSNSKTMSVRKLEERVLRGLKERLLAPELLAEFAAEYQRESKRLRAEKLRNQATVQNSLSETNRRIDRIVSAIEHGSDTPAMHRRLIELEQNRKKLEHEALVQPTDNVAPFTPDLADLYRSKVSALRDALNGDPESREQAINILRTLIDKIVLFPGVARGQLGIELHGQLAAISNLGDTNKRGTDVMILMVAEERVCAKLPAEHKGISWFFEPVTRLNTRPSDGTLERHTA